MDTEQRFYRGDVDSEMLCIALHGDYKYGPLKNTISELDGQSDIFANALSQELSKRNLIVIGYSGRDKSLMEALKKAYQQPGTGRLYWCGYGTNSMTSVTQLINDVNSFGRAAYYIPTDGFDKTILDIARHCMNDNATLLRRIDDLKKNLSVTAEDGVNKFKPIGGVTTKIADTNTFPISIPKTCYQLQVDFGDTKPWDYCRSLEEHNVIAIPYKDMLYAWGNKQVINNVCTNKKSDIAITPFLPKIGVFKEMLVRAITTILAVRAGLSHNKNKIWDTASPFTYAINGKAIKAFKGVEIAVVFDWTYKYITFTPTHMYDKNTELEREEHKQFSSQFTASINGSKPNAMIHKYIKEWSSRLLGLNGIQSKYPNKDSLSEFEFTIRNILVL